MCGENSFRVYYCNEEVVFHSKKKHILFSGGLMFFLLKSKGW